MERLKIKPVKEIAPEEITAREIIKKIKAHGHEAYFAGGAVRDKLLGHELHDIDITTDALPQEICEIFPSTFAKGKTFGVVVVKVDELEFEVATFRRDIGSEDHRRPDKVQFTTPEEDALRRDFTINGLFFDPEKEEVIDFVGGLKDLKEKIIRFIGDPEKRIEEDYLRLLRAVRFSSRLNFPIEKASEEAIHKNAKKINQISAERLRDELGKILINKNRVQGLEQLQELGLLQELLPELGKTHDVPQPKNFHAEGDVWTHILLALRNVEENPTEELVWAVLLHDIAKPETFARRNEIGKTEITFFDHDKRGAEMAHQILERFRFSHHFIENVTWAISQHMRIVNAFRGMSERKQKKLFCDPNIDLLLQLTRADLGASLRPNGQPEMEMYEDALKLRDKFAREMSEEESRQVKKFDLVSGHDIMKLLNIAPGPKVGKIKSEIEKAYLDGRINSRDDALEMIKNL